MYGLKDNSQKIVVKDMRCLPILRRASLNLLVRLIGTPQMSLTPRRNDSTYRCHKHVDSGIGYMYILHTTSGKEGSTLHLHCFLYQLNFLVQKVRTVKHEGGDNCLQNQPCQHRLSQATTPSTNSGHHWQCMAREHPFEGNYGASTN